MIVSGPAFAEDLYKHGVTQSLGTDRRATAVGDLLTVVIVQAAESSSTMLNGSRKSSALNGRFAAGSINERAELALGGSYDGRGEVRRSEKFVTQMSASIVQVLPNGDLMIDGSQRMKINGEETLVEVRGRIRPADIDGEDRVASNRIADAQINYNGKGFVSRSAKPGLIQRLFSFLGLS
ncbi:flagellar basal body L-ring protein FlgH [Sphingomonas colocasiae]|uniref:Flagellar basal body L-ring protein FlgH n=1 Tax=Sphingomonas colocasiae TaxID=1848973 RepID=A0ABS7PW17_9SPHN|nr:flagellar basal body L-ring protein FlgH [Sphingomonas colocasiae]MBY8825549.1 flagellar basal body L-ring protein FlgH [Sphingomonas colocasiae]